MKTLGNLSRRERQIMDAVYATGEATLSQILQRVPNPPTRPALRSLLTILETKGHLRHRKEGREFVYQPVLPRSVAGKSSLGQVIRTFFGGSLSQAVAAYLSDPQTAIAEDDIKELQSLVKQARRKRSDESPT
jgi:BlaI family penicillinase repressor